jgi:hypothetical protein
MLAGSKNSISGRCGETARRRYNRVMTPRRTALVRTMPILLFMVLFGTLIVFLALRTAGGMRRSEEVVATYAAALPACDGEPVAGAPVYEPGEDGPHLVVLLRRAGAGWAPDPAVLPAVWGPTQPTAAELVLCLEASLPLTAPACDEVSSGMVYGYAATARLVAAATAVEVARTTLNSAPDPGCWESEPEAQPVSNEQIEAWLAPYVSEEAGR